MYFAEVTNPDPSIPVWLAGVILVLGTLLGSGGVGAVMKARSDRKAGIDAQEVVEDDAIVERWRQLSQAQIEMLLNPLRTRLSEVEAAVKTLEDELKKSRRKYWVAIPYIRALMELLRHHPDTTTPPVPAEIAEDI